MTHVDFYVLDTTDETARLRAVCRLAQDVFSAARQLHIHTQDAPQTQRLDSLLWTFQDISFLPHAVAQTGTRTAPITLRHDYTPEAGIDVLINLAVEPPAFFSQFERVIEIVDEQPAVRKAGRTRYRFYRDRGYPLQHHPLNA
ncbi:DNA polymerase III subunit chi [Acidihalobacter ferrooxydans]|uniref:DNA polymerase III subunit chi n=1 Tax=Acidihalobacter ferrooxydans TaxID=1765967 RepID=A0A1P8UHF3_9GAMM|nr:DNA polymerase III subunit chi [Acidihalobacter ferrooxydans]APZ43250.1 hypothetical protein BW247_09215 [Acidihalobacter ferrooxydans]